MNISHFWYIQHGGGQRSHEHRRGWRCEDEINPNQCSPASPYLPHRISITLSVCQPMKQAGSTPPSPTRFPPCTLSRLSPPPFQPIACRRLCEHCLRVTLATSQGFPICFVFFYRSLFSVSVSLSLRLCLVTCIFKGSAVNPPSNAEAVFARDARFFGN